MTIDKQLLERMIAEKMVKVEKHPNYDLYIYNYTPNCVFSKTWNDVTMQCRGLILDGDMNVVARPMRKFFNYEELDKRTIPDLPFKAYDKIDGSMGVLYWPNDLQPLIATRGSFVSEQAIHASHILQKRYRHVKFNRDYTYIFEIVYPEDAKVVRYGQKDDLVLLAIINTKTGEEIDPTTMRQYFDVPKEYPCTDYKQLRSLYDGTNREGFVVKFDNGFRMKMKYEEYLRIFNVKYCLTERTILDAMIEHRLDEVRQLIDGIDEEVTMFVDATVAKIQHKYDSIEAEAKRVFRNDFPTRKEAAEYFKQFAFAGLLFKMLDGGDYEPIIWTMVKRSL